MAEASMKGKIWTQTRIQAHREGTSRDQVTQMAKNATLPSLERGRTSFPSREKHGLSDAVTMR